MKSFTALIRSLLIFLLFSWGIVNIIITGNTIAKADIVGTINNYPTDLQSKVGDSYTQAIFLAKNSQEGNSASIGTVFVGDNKNPELFAYYWNTYWMYPATVSSYNNLSDALSFVGDVIVYSDSPNINQIVLDSAGTKTVEIIYLNQYARLVRVK